MWTLRDLWHLIDPQAKREWEMQQRFPGDYKGGDIPAPLHNTLQNFWDERLLKNPSMNTPAATRNRSLTDQEYYIDTLNGMAERQRRGVPFMGGTL